ncbi:MAG: phosphodiesterase, partial [Ilumatobacter sp.]|nr:phosphodiesterase [Ilumatobacter sp.]
VLPAGGADDPIDVVVDLDGVRLVALDTTIPGSHEGRLTEAQLTWLDARLAEAPDVPTIVAQHHPPVASGVRSMDDACGFADGGAEADVLRRHSHVEAVLSGHLHRAFHRRCAGTISTTAPSTACQLELRLNGGDTTYSSEPTGFLLHDWRPGVGLVTHVVPTGSFDTWSPPWAG